MKIWGLMVGLTLLGTTAPVYADDPANEQINQAAFGMIVNAVCGVNTAKFTDRAYEKAIALRSGNKLVVDQAISIRMERAINDIRANGEKEFCDAIAHLEWN